ncbi:ribosomal protein S18-alanine N-acetyltransferase [Mesobacillus sp. AQ2]|jgi:[ribosomal protein S18]-alanine N-acetyltransferase|uniref:ribosomal protein S18-alanine N-acetyltransferase n=1 Tax=Bacillaceae TaxID=186817 RepID=UPI0011A3BCA2|nr:MULTISPECIES: ribosomal protein S18-alanine N-acetyltransferase [Bacillaceae]MCM3125850.1 ribosomal protein S18-alanine N-acetyltransferase [Mesobacillus sp. MER 33]MCM3235871.1 ribosomal protein S18-alanine N-acetyltransferase [Mesobacillus sp. MER 48]WHX40854.1 ribosomal protein S18-alanine N-acetyltransferase [Mesobacillus sp. AQ2]
MNKTITFRNMTVDDLDDVMEVEVNSFTVPWSREAFFNELTKNQFAQYLVVEVDQKVVGYCGVWIIVDEAHITNIALLPEYRGMKLGEALMAKVMELAREMGALRMTLEVRVSNNRAQNLYRKFGFEEGAIRKQYYTDNMEDALVMWVNL